MRWHRVAPNRNANCAEVGGFKHSQHLAFNSNEPTPVPNLYVSMHQRLGIEADKFGTSTRTLSRLEV